MSHPVILFRRALEMEGEMAACAEHLPTVGYRTQVPPGSLVIPRYSVLPHYEELEEELALSGSRLVNTYAQHKWVANLVDWGGPDGVLADVTPRTWTNWMRLPSGVSFVVKGRTNSRKQNWATHMFAPTAADVPVVARRLLDDSYIQDQGLVVREYVPLKRLDTGLNDLPITNEHRTFWFVHGGKVHFLASGYYWQASHPETEDLASFPPEALALVTMAAQRVGEHVNFFVLDVAETEAGGWIVVEVNDGSMSGLCGVSGSGLYSNLAQILQGR